MTYRNVLISPDPNLRERSQELTREEWMLNETQQLTRDLIETMKQENGIGIAAPQIGVLKRVIIVNVEGGAKPFFNPMIVSKSFVKVESEEGCISVPGIFGIVKRHRSVTIEAIDQTGSSVRFRADGLAAIVFQHEIDHLDGILFIDKVIRYTSHPKL